jgi:hypothetical protein
MPVWYISPLMFIYVEGKVTPARYIYAPQMSFICLKQNVAAPSPSWLSQAAFLFGIVLN